MGLMQLSLWDLNTLEVTCPRCGYHFKPSLSETTRERLLEVLMRHERVRALPGESRLFLKMSPTAFLAGYTVGVSLWDQESVYTASAAFKQLRKFAAWELVRLEQKGKYHQYRLLISPPLEQEKSGKISGLSGGTIRSNLSDRRGRAPHGLDHPGRAYPVNQNGGG